MIWRKFKLDWRYAIGEFMIVVLGVLAAFWVENWNSERLDLLLERQYMQSLIRDLQSDIESVDSTLERTEIHAAGDRIVLDSIESASVDVTPREFAQAVAYLSRLTFPVQSRETINDLMSTGNLRIIRSEEVRSRIADYYASTEMQSQWQPGWRVYQQDMARLVPRFINTALRSAVEYEDERPEWYKSGDEITDADANRILGRLIDHPDAVPTIENIFRAQALNFTYAAGLKHEAEALIQIVENYQQQL
jgi:hypothetical protein